MRSVADRLESEGFERIGEIRYDLGFSAWWHAGSRVQLLAVELNSAVLLKGSKSYYLVSIGEEGETWARDIGPLHDYLESHFRDLHLSFSHIRDVPAFLAERQGRLRGSPNRGSPRGTGQVGPQLHRAEHAAASIRRLRELDSGDLGLLSVHLKRAETQRQAEADQLRALEDATTAEADTLRHLQHEYRAKGSAASLTFTISSSIQVAHTEVDQRDAVRAIVKELGDVHRFQVTQKLSGGSLRIQVTEAQHPALIWIEQWFGGLLNPNQLERLRSCHAGAVDASCRHVAVTADEDIVVDSSVVEQKKLLAPRVVSALLSRLDKTERIDALDSATTPHARMLHVGLHLGSDQSSPQPWRLPLTQMGQVSISGMTGSGKSVLGRVLIEELVQHDGVGVLVLDPRNQSAGLLVPQDDPGLLSRYERFGLDRPRTVPLEYYAPGNKAIQRLPSDLGVLADRRTILSLKGLDDGERCALFRSALDAVFEKCSEHEVPGVRCVVLVEEAQLFTRRLVAPGAKPEAEQAEAALDRVLREGRKYGLRVVVSSQSVKDFSRDAATIRQNINTRVFCHNSDREIEYARDYLDDPRDLVRLRPGVALFCNPAWGVIKVAVRPPLSKLWDYSEQETVAITRRASTAPVSAISEDARRLLERVHDRFSAGLEPPNMSQAAIAAGISSRRRLQQLVDELIAAGHIATRRLPGHGQPRVIELASPPLLSAAGTEDGQNPDGSGQEVDNGSPTHG